MPNTKIAKDITVPGAAATKPLYAQAFVNGEIHDWYRILFGYSDHLVANLLDDFGMTPGCKVLDPFCGTGTTLIECMKRGINAVGVDANPSSVFAARVKTNWDIRGSRLKELLSEVEDIQAKKLRNESALRRDLTYRYLEESGMIERGWISTRPLLKSLAIKAAINDLGITSKYRNLLMLVLIAEVVNGASNVKFGPELYCAEPKSDHDVFAGFTERIEAVISDLKKTEKVSQGKGLPFMGDSRRLEDVKGFDLEAPFDAIISSPPYPTEHDYTRNARLELAFLENVIDRDTLRSIKVQMIRSHTKGIYKTDNDAELVENDEKIKAITKTLQRKIKGKDYGFARLYPKVFQEYFGGMKRHLSNIRPYLKEGAKCAYIVGDQSSYLRVYIPTAEILASIAIELGFKVIDIKHWRSRWSTITSKKVHENILLLEKI